MDTALEALFRVFASRTYLSDDELDGEVDSPTGNFARFTINEPDIDGLLEEFTDVTEVYGVPDRGDMTGHFLVRFNDHGFIFINSYDDRGALDKEYEALAEEYSEWLNS